MKKIIAILTLLIAAATSLGGGFPDGEAATEMQIKYHGDSRENEEDGVKVSKTVSGTDTENVFDITLSVETQTDIKEAIENPDMAVVIVMDVSNTMKINNMDGSAAKVISFQPTAEEYEEAYASSNPTRYMASMRAAESFINSFAENSMGTSSLRQIGCVAFNSNASKIFGLKDCRSSSQADALIASARSSTGSIMFTGKTNVNGEYVDAYSRSKDRFTNIDAGLKMAGDMLKDSNAANKFILLLSDGYPTTYIKNGLDIPIYAVGVGLDDRRTIGGYLKLHEGKDFSTIDCYAQGDYVIGDTIASFKDWLAQSIGSGKEGYFYDCADTDTLTAAYDSIFEEMVISSKKACEALWVTKDDLSAPSCGHIDFIGFYNKSGDLSAKPYELNGSYGKGMENTAMFSAAKNSFSWDLKNSGFTEENEGGKTICTYELKYRIRLKNELPSFMQDTAYNSNGNTQLTYNAQTNEGSAQKTIGFPIPQVEGYLADISFKKTDDYGAPLDGGEFTLSHREGCSICDEIGSSIAIGDMTAVSGIGGIVRFSDIPSGHEYTLRETKAPYGYIACEEQYPVSVSYGVVSVIGMEELTVKNTYAGSISSPLSFEKVVSGDVPYGSSSFKFRLEAAGYSTDNGNIMTPKQMPMPHGSAEGIKDISLSGEGTADLGEIAFYKAGRYTYKLYEIAEDAPGYTYDESIYTVIFDITKDEGGFPSLEKTVLKDGKIAESIVFENKYALPNGTLTVHKSVSEGSGDEEFTFTAQFTDRLTSRPLSGAVSTSRGMLQLDRSGSVTFTLKHGESITFTSLPYGTGYTVSEKACEGYAPITEGATGEICGDMNTYILNEVIADIPVNGDAQTGDSSNALLWVIISICCGAGIVLLVILARKKLLRR